MRSMNEDVISSLRSELAEAEQAAERAVRAFGSKHIGGEWEACDAAQAKLMQAQRKLADAEGRPYAVLCDCPLSWDLGAPAPTLLQSDNDTHLFFILTDSIAGVGVGHVRFHHCSATLFGSPGDETFKGHPLSGSGFEPYLAMRVINSPWIAQLEKIDSVHSRHNPANFRAYEHFIFPFHDTTFECVARAFTASVVNQSLAEAVKSTVDLLY